MASALGAAQRFVPALPRRLHRGMPPLRRWPRRAGPEWSRRRRESEPSVASLLAMPRAAEIGIAKGPAPSMHVSTASERCASELDHGRRHRKVPKWRADRAALGRCRIASRSEPIDARRLTLLQIASEPRFRPSGTRAGREDASLRNSLETESELVRRERDDAYAGRCP
jgi:hypothetical protein